MGKAELQEVENDLFGIAWRIREVDSNYRLYFNNRTKKYEVYAKGALQFAVPFETLDARTVEKARETRVERLSQIVKEIDAQNRAVEARAQKAQFDRLASACQL